MGCHRTIEHRHRESVAGSGRYSCRPACLRAQAPRGIAQRSDRRSVAVATVIQVRKGDHGQGFAARSAAIPVGIGSCAQKITSAAVSLTTIP